MTKTRQARFKQRFRPVRYPYARKALLTRPGVAYNQDYLGAVLLAFIIAYLALGGQL